MSENHVADRLRKIRAFAKEANTTTYRLKMLWARRYENRSVKADPPIWYQIDGKVMIDPEAYREWIATQAVKE